MNVKVALPQEHKNQFTAKLFVGSHTPCNVVKGHQQIRVFQKAAKSS